MFLAFGIEFLPLFPMYSKNKKSKENHQKYTEVMLHSCLYVYSHTYLNLQLLYTEINQIRVKTLSFLIETIFFQRSILQ